MTTQNPFAPTALEEAKDASATLARRILAIAAYGLLIPVVVLLGLILIKGAPAISWDYLTGAVRSSGAAGGIWGPLIGTFWLTLLVVAIVVPTGILGGIYLNEYAKDNAFTRAILLATTSLAGVPSIVHALFGLGAFVTVLALGKSLIAAALTLAVMNLPVVVASTREALAAVPKSFREAVWNLGASRWQGIWTIVLPNSISGILTGVILAVARAAGETAPIIVTGALIYMRVPNSGAAHWMPYGLREEFMALSFHLNCLCKDVPNAPETMKFGSALVLLAMIFTINGLAIWLRSRLRQTKKW
jgi:phosphate transport system permease protein